MKRINRAENWERVYEAFQQINFSAWDYRTIKESLLDHLKLYFAEDFNDFIESSELVEYIEIFAYLGELMAYRIDLNAHENFITTAQRKESILRLAKLLSYKSSRNIPARGLVKITSVSTTERLLDSTGLNLANRTIAWNDPTNQRWKEQFLLVMNRVLQQQFGTVLKSDRVQVQDVLFELYALRQVRTNKGVISYNINVNGQSYPMELVSAKLDENGPREKRPEQDQVINVLYLSDGLGDTSENTGFFFLTKQGSIGKTTAHFDGVTPNQFLDIDEENCNETDVWLNNINPDSGAIIESDDPLSSRRPGEWERVDVANSQNVIFNTNPNRNKYEVETLDQDKFRIVFGDGNFSAIPSGTFDVWYRISANENLVIPTTSIQNKSSALQYVDQSGKEQSLKFNFSLMDPIQNAAASEDIERIRRIAPSVYYTQDRMVNGRDYNEFMLQDNTILKLRAVNRTFAGDSKFIYWKDPREYYENVKIFGDDLVLYFKPYPYNVSVSGGELPNEDGGANAALIDAIIYNHITPMFDTVDWFTKATLSGVNPTEIRKEFSLSELISLQNSLFILINNRPDTFYMTFNVNTAQWEFSNSNNAPQNWWIRVTSNSDNSWDIFFWGQKVVAHSDEVKFWISNDDKKVIEYDTLNSRYDQIVILKANVGTSSCALDRNYKMRVLESETISAGENIGLPDSSAVSVISEDENGDNIPDNVDLTYLIGPDDYVYFSRECESCEWEYRKYSEEVFDLYTRDQDIGAGLWKRERGREGINFLWLHRTPRYHLIDPAASNLIDMFIIPRGYYTFVRRWLAGFQQEEPERPTPSQLRTDYGYLLESKMISDTVVLHPGKIKPIFGDRARDELKASIKVVRSSNRSLTSNQIKSAIVDITNRFFDINAWEFGETFYFTELASVIHSELAVHIDSVVLVPKFSNNVFGDLYQVYAREDEILQASLSVNDIEIVESLNPRVLRQPL